MRLLPSSRPPRRGRPGRAQRSRLPQSLVLVFALLVLGGAYTALAPSGRAAVNTPVNGSDLVARGHALFTTGCSSCHGLNAEGSTQAPTLVGVGAAAVDFQVGTGRMPLAQFGAMAERKPPKYSPEEITALSAYVASLAPGPAVPDPSFIAQYTRASIPQGGQIFRTNCSQCHNALGEGGALGWGVYAPDLSSATPAQMYEAMITGPEQMPVFADTQLTPQEKLDVVDYLMNVNKDGGKYTVGGHPIGRIGPVPEGAVAWIVGIGACVLFTLWIGTRIS